VAKTEKTADDDCEAESVERTIKDVIKRVDGKQKISVMNAQYYPGAATTASTPKKTSKQSACSRPLRTSASFLHNPNRSCAVSVSIVLFSFECLFGVFNPIRQISTID